MPALTRPQKITFAEMRASGVRGLLIYCSDYRCSHSTAISGDRWPDDVWLSDIEPKFTLPSVRATRHRCPPEFRLGQETYRGNGLSVTGNVYFLHCPLAFRSSIVCAHQDEQPLPAVWHAHARIKVAINGQRGGR